MSYSDELERKCTEVEIVYPEIKQIVDEILRINRISGFEFDYDIEKILMMYETVKKILNKP